VIILLDASAKKVQAARDKYGDIFGQLLVPGTCNSLTARRLASPITPLGLDNGCYAGTLDRRAWIAGIKAVAGDPGLKFVAMPDTWGDARRTLELFTIAREWVPAGVPLALVAQDGLADLSIPWDEIKAVFLGGSDDWRASHAAVCVLKAARILGKWVHVGRVNTPAAIRRWRPLADSCDGSGVSRYDDMLHQAARALTDAGDDTPDLFESEKNLTGPLD